MRNKKMLVTLFCCLAISTNIVSKEVLLTKTGSKSEHCYEVPTTDITVRQEGNRFSIYSNTTLGSVTITIEDSMGNAIYENVIPLLSGQPYDFLVCDLEAGMYTIRLTSQTEIYKGNFYIDGTSCDFDDMFGGIQ